MKFSKIWLNWKVVGLLSVFVATVLLAGWIWHRVAMKDRQKSLLLAVEKYGGGIEFDGAGYEIENWLIDLKIARASSSAPYSGVEIFGRNINLENFLSDPIAVRISGSPAIDDEDIMTIAGFGTIRSLELPVSTLGDAQAEIIGRCNNLEYLDLTGVSLSDRGFAHLASLTRLRGFTFSNSVLSDRSCEVLLKLKRLSHLEIRRTSFTMEGLKRLLKEHPALRELTITEGVLRKDELKLLGDLNPEIKIILPPTGDPFKSLGLETIFHSQK